MALISAPFGLGSSKYVKADLVSIFGDRRAALSATPAGVAERPTVTDWRAERKPVNPPGTTKQ
jgi:hypothetical protein